MTTGFVHETGRDRCLYNNEVQECLSCGFCLKRLVTNTEVLMVKTVEMDCTGNFTPDVSY